MRFSGYLRACAVAAVAAASLVTASSTDPATQASELRRLKVAIPAYIFSDDLRG